MSADLRCPQCGGELVLTSGDRLLRCGFCDGTLFVDRSGVVNHYRVPFALDHAAALAALRRFLAGTRTVKDLDRKAEVGTGAALTFPMWFFRLETGRGEATVVEPAAATPITQLAALEVPAGKLERFVEPDAGVEQTPASVPLETARGWLGERLAESPRSHLVESALVELPLWRFVYRYGGRDWLALVDAATGAVLAADYPSKRESPFVGVAALGTLTFLVLGFAFSNLLLKLLVFLLAAVPLFGLALWVARKV